jgi:hypothetical protein
VFIPAPLLLKSKTAEVDDVPRWRRAQPVFFVEGGPPAIVLTSADSSLTDDDLDRTEGDAEKLIGRVQERYGYQREEAKREVDDFLSRHNMP